MPYVGMVLVISAMLTACSSESQADEAFECDQTITEREPLLGSMEAMAVSSTEDVEAWALFFPTWEATPGSPIMVPVGEEFKIVWRATGSGDEFEFRAVDVDGTEVPLRWGPNRQGGNWDRPGQERGTGWLLPHSGCWTLELRRGGATHVLVVLAS